MGIFKVKLILKVSVGAVYSACSYTVVVSGGKSTLIETFTDL